MSYTPAAGVPAPARDTKLRVLPVSTVHLASNGVGENNGVEDNNPGEGVVWWLGRGISTDGSLENGGGSSSTDAAAWWNARLRELSDAAW